MPLKELAVTVTSWSGAVLYWSCAHCKRKLISCGSGSECVRCGRGREFPGRRARYQLTLNVMTDEGRERFTVFGSALDPVFGVRAEVLMEIVEATDDGRELLRDAVKEILNGSALVLTVHVPNPAGTKASSLKAMKIRRVELAFRSKRCVNEEFFRLRTFLLSTILRQEIPTPSSPDPLHVFRPMLLNQRLSLVGPSDSAIRECVEVNRIVIQDPNSNSKESIDMPIILSQESEPTTRVIDFDSDTTAEE